MVPFRGLKRDDLVVKPQKVQATPIKNVLGIS